MPDNCVSQVHESENVQDGVFAGAASQDNLKAVAWE
jgi:hypothetical protein